jgi:hypothetical protein
MDPSVRPGGGRQVICSKTLANKSRSGGDYCDGWEARGVVFDVATAFNRDLEAIGYLPKLSKKELTSKCGWAIMAIWI